MAKKARNGRGTGTGTKNPDRRNGKAWTKKRIDPLGRALTGRGKPSGRSVRGTRVKRVGDYLYPVAYGEFSFGLVEVTVS